MAEIIESKNFIHTFIEEDIAEGMTSFLKEQLEIYFMERPAETEK